MIKIDWSVFIQIANFLFLIWVLNIILYKPIRKILLQRKDKITGLENQIAKYKADTVEKDQAFVSGIKEARVKGFAEKESRMNEAAEEEKKIIDEINAESQANLSEIRGKIVKDTGEVRAALEEKIADFADAIGQKIMGRVV